MVETQREARRLTPHTRNMIMLNQALSLHFFCSVSRLGLTARVLISASGRKELKCAFNHKK